MTPRVRQAKRKRKKTERKSDIHDFVQGVGIYAYIIYVHICIYTNMIAYMQAFYS